MWYITNDAAGLCRHRTIEFPSWVKWTHHSEGKTHCEECLKWDGCWFLEGKVPPCPHHPYCHCTLEPISYAVVLNSALTYSDYGKFDPFLFDSDGRHPNGKRQLFEEWGYTVDDARWLQAGIERQAREKYISGDYILGKLDKNGQRISIRVVIPRRDRIGNVSFITGWMVYPNGKIRLTTPYEGK